MVISMRSNRVKQFLLKIAKFVFCHSNNTTKLYLSGNHNFKVTRHKIICEYRAYMQDLEKNGQMFATHYFTKSYLHRLHNCAPMNRHLTISLEVQIPRKSIY